MAVVEAGTPLALLLLLLLLQDAVA